MKPNPKLVQIGDEKYNVDAIARMVDAAAKAAYGGSERTMIELIARLIRAQDAEIKRLRSQADNVNSEHPS